MVVISNGVLIGVWCGVVERVGSDWGFDGGVEVGNGSGVVYSCSLRCNYGIW